MAEIYCNTCMLSIRSAEQRESHYRTEWHRYNVKRKCAGYAPISQEVFESKLAALQQQQEAPKIVYNSFKCLACNKKFKSEEMYSQHSLSSKHKKAVSSSGMSEEEALLREAKPEASEVEDSSKDIKEDAMDTDEPDVDPAGKPIAVTECLFCGVASDDVQKNLEHMAKAHSFFVPYLEWCTSVDGLLEYLGFKIGVGHVCLWCDGKGRASYPSTRAVQQHMMDKGHCSINFDEGNDEEFDEWYDFTQPVGDEAAADAIDDKGKQLVVSDGKAVESLNALGELVLEDGTIIGHRQNRVYYKQSFRPAAETKSQIVAELVAQYRMLALPGYAPKQDKQERDKNILRIQARQALMVGITHNRQKHYKRQVLV